MFKKSNAASPVSISEENVHTSKPNVQPYDMVVFCHLRWEFVFQRPQHLITRLAKNYKILFIEEPIDYKEGAENDHSLQKVSENLTVLKPHVADIKDISTVLQSIFPTLFIPIGWFYSPSFSTVLHDFIFETVIYDCMDELSLFKGAPKELIIQEKVLLHHADLVFTGGKSLYEAKKSSNEDVYCFPSSVDQQHFEKAFQDVPVPDDINNISSPVVGYFGVIDERIDLDLLHQTAILLPDVSFVMIGPLAKIGEEDLPREKNIHYLGMKSYEQLPNYIKAFDVAMMPFALNDATKFISPTKTLEYMAAKKPIISTAITDVVRDYNECVAIIETSEEFAESIEDFLEDTEKEWAAKYKDILQKTSWDATASKMNKLLKAIAHEI